MASILAVTNSTTFVSLLTQHFQAQGIQVTACANGESAVSVIVETKPDVVVVELNQSQIDAWALIEAVQKKELEKPLPFAFVTDQPEVHERMRALFLGVKGYWDKGDTQAVIRQLDELIQQSQLSLSSTRKFKKGSFHGNLNSFPVLDVFQLVANYNKSGTLHLKTPVKGMVYFQAGEVVDARWKERDGLVAIYKIINQPEGEFEFIEGVVQCMRRITTPWMALAMEAARLKDELDKLKSAYSTRLTPQDIELLEELVFLQLVAVDNLNSLLAGIETGTSLAQALQKAQIVDAAKIAEIVNAIKPKEVAKSSIQQDTKTKHETPSRHGFAANTPGTKISKKNEIGMESTKHMRISQLRRQDSRSRSSRTMIAETILQRLLLSLSLLNFEQLNKCMQEQVRLKLQNQDITLSQVLVNLGFVDEKTLEKIQHFNNEHGEPLIPGYQVERLIGEGGLGAVYLANKISNPEQKVALKVFVPPAQDASTNVVRFIRECEVAKTLDHANIIKAYDFGEFFGMYYIVMEYIAGISLEKKVIEEGPLEEKSAIDICEKILQALIKAWDEGFIHRDIKPSNILIGENLVKLADFGLAKALTSDLEITQGALVGTPFYMSPEQFSGKELDYRSDVYSLGVTLYAILTAHLPFTKSSQVAIGSQHMTATPPHPNKFNVTVSKPMVALLFKLLAKEPEDRCKSPEELLDNLRRVRNGKMPRGRIAYFQETRRKLFLKVGVPVLALLLLAGGGYFAVSTVLQRQAAQNAALAAVSVQKGDEYRGHCQSALAGGDFETAYRFTSEAHHYYKLASTQDKRWKEYDARLAQIGDMWVKTAQGLYASDERGKLDLAIKCCDYNLRLRDICADSWSELENLKGKSKHKRDELYKRRQQDLTHEIDLQQEQCQQTLGRGEIEAAYAVFGQAMTATAGFDKEYPESPVTDAVAHKMAEDWLAGVRQLRKLGKLAEALQGCRYGARLKEFPVDFKDELRNMERGLEKEIEAQSAFEMTVDKVWLANGDGKEAAARDAFDVKDKKVCLHLSLQLRNYDAKQQLLVRYKGDNIDEKKGSLAKAPAQGEYHWATPIAWKKKMAGDYTLQVELSCKGIVVSKDITCKLVQLADDLLFIGKNERGYEEYMRARDKMVMVLIPAGEFTMGDPGEEGYVDEKPQHAVVMDSYLIDKYEVSNAQYALFLNWWQSAWEKEKGKYDCPLSKEAMKELRYDANRVPKYWDKAPYNAPNLPVVGVDWFDAYAYARWANNVAAPSQMSCLPSEAQWEKAAGWDEEAGKLRLYPWGNQIDAQKANFWGGDRKSAEPVTEHAAGKSPYALFNMAGNVCEWCDDWYDRKYYSLSPRTNPINRKMSKHKTFRGGGFNSKDWELRNSRRRNFEPHLSNVETGFRCVRWLGEK